MIIVEGGQGKDMPRKKKPSARTGRSVEDFRHADARRKNNPPAGIALAYETQGQQTTHCELERIKVYGGTWKSSIPLLLGQDREERRSWEVLYPG